MVRSKYSPKERGSVNIYKMTTFRQLLQEGCDFLVTAGIVNYRREAEWLLEYVAGQSLTELLCDLERECPSRLTDAYISLLQRRAGGEPLQHLLGTVDFFGYHLLVGPGVLIPRPESETLVEQALRRYSGRGAVCDICTGSGAIAIVLARELPKHPTVVAGDICQEALFYAETNRQLFQVDNMHLFQGDLFSPLRAGVQFSLITANPPYVALDEYDDLPREVHDFDPRSALVAEEHGLEMVRRVLQEGYDFLVVDGWMLCEIGETQADQAMGIMRARGYRLVGQEADLSGRSRMVIGCK